MRPMISAFMSAEVQVMMSLNAKPSAMCFFLRRGKSAGESPSFRACNESGVGEVYMLIMISIGCFRAIVRSCAAELQEIICKVFAGMNVRKPSEVMKESCISVVNWMISFMCEEILHEQGQHDVCWRVLRGSTLA